MEGSVPRVIAEEIGKISGRTFAEVIAPRLGAQRPEVLVGPRHGVDTGIVDLGHGSVMALTTDPFFVMPELGWKRAAWFAVHIVASDAATSGLPPAYLAVDLNLPPSLSDEDLAQLWEAVDVACCELGLAIVTGHTGRYEGCSFPMLGGATVLAVGPAEKYVAPSMARPGDVIILTKGAAIETTALFGATFPDHLEAALGPVMAREADGLFGELSIVRDALTVVEIGVREDGVTTLHDATERGVWGGLAEIAQAAGTGLLVERNAVPLPAAARAVCALVGIDPYTSSSEGTLLCACRPNRGHAALQRLADAGIAAAIVGELTPLDEGLRVATDGVIEPLPVPEVDPFWPAYARALQEWNR